MRVLVLLEMRTKFSGLCSSFLFLNLSKLSTLASKMKSRYDRNDKFLQNECECFLQVPWHNPLYHCSEWEQAFQVQLKHMKLKTSFSFTLSCIWSVEIRESTCLVLPNYNKWYSSRYYVENFKTYLLLLET